MLDPWSIIPSSLALTHRSLSHIPSYQYARYESQVWHCIALLSIAKHGRERNVDAIIHAQSRYDVCAWLIWSSFDELCTHDAWSMIYHSFITGSYSQVTLSYSIIPVRTIWKSSVALHCIALHSMEERNADPIMHAQSRYDVCAWLIWSSFDELCMHAWCLIHDPSLLHQSIVPSSLALTHSSLSHIPSYQYARWESQVWHCIV